MRLRKRGNSPSKPAPGLLCARCPIVPKLNNMRHRTFAAYWRVSEVRVVDDYAVQKWEIGEKKASGIALKLLNIVERNGLDVLV